MHVKHPSASRSAKAWSACLVMLVACGGGGADTPAPAPTPPAPPVPVPGPAPSGAWTLAWAEEFDGPAGSPPNPAHWKHELGNRETNGWGNHELQYYTASPRNAALNGQGLLEIRAERTSEALPCWNGKNCNFTSARLSSQGKVTFSEGKLEARIKVPAGIGLWPAFWALGEGPWPSAGEIDVMEWIGKTPTMVYGTVHGPGYSGANGVGKPLAKATPYSDDFHVFTVIKRPNEIIWQVDGQEFHRVTPASLPNGSVWVFERTYFLLLNLAVGGDWPGPPDATTDFPATLQVDYIRIYKQS